MQYVAAIGIVVIILTLWIGIDWLARRRGLTGMNDRERCGDCSCDASTSCQTKSDPTKEPPDTPPGN